MTTACCSHRILFLMVSFSCLSARCWLPCEAEDPAVDQPIATQYCLVPRHNEQEFQGDQDWGIQNWNQPREKLREQWLQGVTTGSTKPQLLIRIPRCTARVKWSSTRDVVAWHSRLRVANAAATPANCARGNACRMLKVGERCVVDQPQPRHPGRCCRSIGAQLKGPIW